MARPARAVPQRQPEALAARPDEPAVPREQPLRSAEKQAVLRAELPLLDARAAESRPEQPSEPRPKPAELEALPELEGVQPRASPLSAAPPDARAELEAQMQPLSFA